MKHKHLITIIRRSCLTGRVVWVYRGPSNHAASRSYRRACRREVERVTHWSNTTARRAQNITKLLNDCMAELSLSAELTPLQRESAQQLHSLCRRQNACNSEFYEHILEERRRRNSIFKDSKL